VDAQRTGVGDDLTAAVAPGIEARAPSEVLARLPARVAATYAVAGTAWILASDLLVAVGGDESVEERLPEIAKGLLFVLGTAAILLVVLRQVTRRFDRMFLQTITAQRDLYEGVLATSTDVVTVFAGDGRMLWVNDAVTDVLGWRPEELVGRPGADAVHPSDQASARGFREDVVAGRAGDAPRTFLFRHRDGGTRAMEVRASPLHLPGLGTGLAAVARDVTDRDRSERLLRSALARDVTGLPGLRALLAELEAIDELQPDGLVATVAIADVERFGDLNGLHGRSRGDEVLRELARRLEAAFPDALGVWRHGADEFVVVVIEERAGRAAPPHVLADRVRAVADVPVVVDKQGSRAAVGLSVGVARVAVRSPDGEGGLGADLLRAGEAALAEAKRHPDRIAIRADGSPRPQTEQARLVAELRQAIEQGQLVVHYQPKVRLADLRASGMEALVRWEHPERGTLPPAAFLPAVAEGNLSGALLAVVLRDALGQLAAWSEDGCADPGLAVCVNVSADDLRRRRFVDDVFVALAEVGVEPGRLGIELTEQALLADVPGARRVIDELRAEGIRVAIDDFGTGYSTLEHVRDFEVDEIKIDKSFVQRLGSSPADEAIVDSILAIAQRLEVPVVAEGVEDVAVLEYLRERGCELGQGYLFARPAPAQDIDPGRRWGPAG